MKGGDIHIKVFSTDDYRKTTKFLDEQNLLYHTFPLPKDKPIRVVIKKLPAFTKVEDIKKELIEKQIPVLNVRQVIKNVDGEIIKLPTFVVETERSVQGKLIDKVTHLTDLGITVERFNTTPGPKQCHNCQRYGHSRGHCKHQARCLKCGEKHPTHEYCFLNNVYIQPPSAEHNHEILLYD
ncbi:Nucleic-acid-binding protein from transposon X-element, partial [Stegodyphus mimosarum]